MGYDKFIDEIIDWSIRNCSFDFVEDMEGSYMDGAAVGLWGAWKVVVNKIVIETRLFPETMSEDEFIYETLSLHDLKFVDENNVLGI